MPRKPGHSRNTQYGAWCFNPVLFHKKYIVNEITNCWQWQGAQGPQGALFGCLKNNKGQMTQARRVAYMIEHRQDVQELELRMTCHNKMCVNPQHMSVHKNRKI